MARISITKEATVDPFFNNVSLLLPFDGSFNDASNNNFTVTANGNVQISSAQSKFGGSSALFDGNGDYLVLEDDADFNLASTPFTIEAWIYPTLVDSIVRVVISKDTYGSNFSWCIAFDNTKLACYTSNIAGDYLFEANASVQVNTWQHIAVTSDGTTQRLFLNGQLLGTKNAPITNAPSKISIGCAGWNNPNAFYQGYIDDLRVTKGVARYVANFTPSLKSGKLNIQRGGIDPFFNNVSLLLPMDTSFADFSSNNFTVTAFGNVQISNAESKFGGSSALFDGNGDYLELADNDAFNFGTGSFTIEAWIYLTSLPPDIFIVSSKGIGGMFFGFHSGNLGVGRPFVAWDYEVGFGVTTNQWYHVAISRNGTDMRLFVNGNQVGATQTNSLSYNLGLSNLQIGGQIVPSYTPFYFPGYIDELRITKGVARYTANFTPQNSPFSTGQSGKINISKPSFPMATLLAFWRLEGLTDSSGNGNSLTNNNSVQFVAGKIGNCAEFNGSNNYLSLGSFSSSFYSNSPYTFSLWYNITTLKNYFTLIGCYNTGTFNIHGFANGDLAVNNSASADASIAGFFTTNSWNHMVVSRDISGNIKIYKNAVQLYNAPAQVTYGLVPFIEIGALSTYGSTFATNGKIDAVGIWTRELTEKEIKTLYSNGTGLEP